MAVEREDSARELRLEGAGLVAVGAVLLALMGGAFWAGRWVESRGQSPSAGTGDARPGPLSHVVEPTAGEDATRDAGYFDRLEGGERQAEPEREARPPETAREESRAVPVERAASPEPAPAQAQAEVRPSAEPGAFYVQVFAGRDQTTAQQIIDRLRGAGYEVRLFPDGEQAGAIVRVRVGGYPSEERARVIAGNLRQSGYADAFVTRAE